MNQLIDLWQRVSVPWLACGFLAFIFTTVFTARRYWLLIGKDIAFQQVLNIVIMQTVLGNLVATSAGIASYVAFLKTRHNVQIRQGVASLVLARAGDLIMLFVTLLLSSWMVWTQIALLHWAVLLVILAIAGILVLCALTVVFRRVIVDAIRKVLLLGRMDRTAFGTRVMGLFEALAEQKVSRVGLEIIPVLLYTTFILVSMLAFSYCNMRAFGIDVGVWPILFILALTLLMGIVPIQVFGGLGVFDITIFYLYSLFGVDQVILVPVIIGLRVLFYGMNLLLLLYPITFGRSIENSRTETAVQ